MKKSLAVMLALIMVLCMIPTTAFAKLDTGHKIDVTFTVLYVGDEFNIGYNYGTSEKTQFVCQYSTNHSDTAYNNHTIAISDIKAAAGRAAVNSGYQIVGWSKESNANPKVWPLTQSGTTACNKGTTIYLVAKNPNPQPTKPTKPTANDIPRIVGNDAVKVYCTNDKSGHTDETYALIAGSFTIGDVTKDSASGKYSCNITVHAGQYVDKYNMTHGSHTLDQNEDTAVIKLEYNNGKWGKVTQTPVVFNVKCNTEPAAPQKPSNSDIPDIVGTGAVKVECVTYGSGHDVETYELIAGSYDVGEVEGDATNGYTCKITVHAEEYVNKYNEKYTTTNHRLRNANESSKVITLKYENNLWTVISGKPVTFGVECTPIHTVKPSDDTVKGLIGNVKVECSNKEEHIEKEYGLISGSYSIGDVAENECVITIAATEYVNEYNKYIDGHRLADGETDSKTVTLKYEFGEWKLKNSREVPVKFIVTCAPAETYTVTYKDGVSGTAFKDQVYIGLKLGDPTPAFNGIPSRSGYTFTGWAPAVTDTVTGDVTYTAQWKNNDNHTPGGGNGGGHSHYYPTTTPVPVIVIPPKTGDMTIWQSILHFLGII